jgi:hypothetical protein
MLVAVAVLTDGFVPVVGTELSVTVAVRVCCPADVGTHTIVGFVPPRVPMLTPLSKNCVETMLAFAVGVVDVVIVMPDGDSVLAIVEPDAGKLIVIVGVAQAAGAIANQSTAAKPLSTARPRETAGAAPALRCKSFFMTCCFARPYLPPFVRVRGSALAGVTIVGFWKSELAGVDFNDCFFGEPPGLTRLAVTKISKFRYCALSPFDRNSRPTSGMSPKKGTLSFTFFTSSRVRPPITSVAPSQIVTFVETSRTENTG